jgi:hypothetical protein
MYESLKKQTKNFHLYIFAFDDLTSEIITNLDLDFVTVISLDEFETPELKEVKSSRSIAEYCWTCTPSTISHVLNNYDVPHCTYIDADLYFYSDPSVLIEELTESGKSVLITEHRFSFLPKLYEEKRGGRFCVQFITFIREEKSLQVLDKWRGQCIDWCYSRYEDDKFGDQKYLEEWPVVYSNIHILEHQGGGIAPWNLTQYVFATDNGSVSGINLKHKTEFAVVFYHFQYVKFMENNLCDIGWYYISSNVRKVFYEPYIARVIEIEHKIFNLNERYRPGLTGTKIDSLKNILKSLSKNVFGYNILKLDK